MSTKQQRLKQSISIIGAGFMGQAIARGLLAHGINPSQLTLANPNFTEALLQLAKQQGISLTQDNQAASQAADVIILAVKPKIAPQVCRQLKSWSHAPLVISVAAGVTTDLLAQWLPAKSAIIRAMPNMPVSVQAGMTALFAGPQASEQQCHLAQSIFTAVGEIVWLEQESKMDLVTALTGSGPGYIFYLMELLQQAATELGLTANEAQLLVSQMVLGAAKMAATEANQHTTTDVFVQLRQAVTSPQGTTAAAMAVLNQHGLAEMFKQALSAAQQRSTELATALKE